MLLVNALPWHLSVVLIGALLIFLVSWHTVVLAAGIIRFDPKGRTAYVPREPKSNLAPPLRRRDAQRQGGSRGHMPGSSTSHLPIAMIRLFGADCALCQGLGCQECAQTGLR